MRCSRTHKEIGCSQREKRLYWSTMLQHNPSDEPVTDLGGKQENCKKRVLCTLQYICGMNDSS